MGVIELFLGSLATGALAIMASMVLLIGWLHFSERREFGTVGWDPTAVFGRHWKLGIISLALVIFLFGFGLGFWFFSTRFHG